MPLTTKLCRIGHKNDLRAKLFKKILYIKEQEKQQKIFEDEYMELFQFVDNFNELVVESAERKKEAFKDNKRKYEDDNEGYDDDKENRNEAKRLKLT